jgi:uncharacterized cupin superfamily protein
VKEAELRETDTGLVPEGKGWFTVNVRDASWLTMEGAGTWLAFEAEGVPQQIGVGLHMLPPGESTGRYHAESNQEGFLVLSGECLVVVEGEERRMQQWDYFHCPPGTAHIMIGGEQGCTLFMFGARTPGGLTHYLPDPVAAKHGASVKEPTDDWREAYADLDRTFTPVKAPWHGT